MYSPSYDALFHAHQERIERSEQRRLASALSRASRRNHRAGSPKGREARWIRRFPALIR